MDPAHLDALARRLASRRRLLTGLAAGAFGIAGPTVGTARHHRHHHRCPPGRMVCGAICCPLGQSCSGNACGVAPSCVGNPPICSIGADCCSGTCNLNGSCRCSAAGQPCFLGDVDCCNGLHCVGFACG